MFFIFCCFVIAVLLSFLMTPTKTQEPFCCDLESHEPETVSDDATDFWTFEETLGSRTVSELKTLAKTKGVKGVSKLRKSDLVTAIAAA